MTFRVMTFCGDQFQAWPFRRGRAGRSAQAIGALNAIKMRDFVVKILSEEVCWFP
jgi:hypothetical protein